MSSYDIPPTPPAWFAHVERRQEEQQKELDALKSQVGAGTLAAGHLIGELTRVFDERTGEVLKAVAGVKEAVADVAQRCDALEKHLGSLK